MNVLNPALHDTLRTLKLTGMLQTIDARLAQARTGQLGHLDFLQVLCDDEIARRDTAALTRRLRLARFEEQATIETFDFTANLKIPPPYCATWPPYAGSTRASRNPVRAHRGRKKHTSLKVWATT